MWPIPSNFSYNKSFHDPRLLAMSRIPLSSSSFQPQEEEEISFEQTLNEAVTDEEKRIRDYLASRKF